MTLILAFCITTIKFSAFFFTHSTAVLSDASESIMNIVTGIFALFSIGLASKPKDLNHPYGHGKIEFFALGFEGALILVTGIWIFYKASLSLILPHPIDEAIKGVFLEGSTGIINGVLGLYLIQRSKSLNSMTLFAEGKHLMSDTINSFGIVLGLILIHFTRFYLLDSLISFLICGWMLYNGYSLLRRSVAGLMDEADENRVDKIISILEAERSDNWIDIHNLRAQTYGENIHIDAHITLPYYFDLIKSDEELKKIKQLIDLKLRSEVELFFQADPCDPQCCHYCRKLDCSVRSEDKWKDIPWNYKRLVLDQKHYLEN